MRKTILYALCLVSIYGQGAVLHKWQCETSEINEETIDAYHGETVELSCRMTSYGQVVSSCRGGGALFHWQTNGMNNAWWTTNATFSSGTVKTYWIPEMDTGSDSYRFFFQVSDTKGANYRANGTIALQGSPAGNPSLVPLPPQLSFSVSSNVLTITHGTNVWRMVSQ